MKDVHGEHISRGAAGQQVNGMAYHRSSKSGQGEQGSSMKRWTGSAAGSALPLRGSAGVGRLRDGGEDLGI